MMSMDMKKAFGIGLAYISSLAFTATTYATGRTRGGTIDLCPQFQFKDVVSKNPDNIVSIIGTVVSFLFVIAIIAAFIFLLYGGLRWIVSGGDKGKVEEARNTIIAAVIGLIVIFLAYIILNVVLNLFGMSISELRLPSLVANG